MLLEAEFWVAVSFFLLLAVFGYLGVHRMLTKALDDRKVRIETELQEARRLNEEAAALLQEYRRRLQDAEREAGQIIAAAQTEAERTAAEAHAKLDEFVARRRHMAEVKIAQAEAQAVADVRTAAAEAATAAAERILIQTVKGKVADDLLTRGIEDVKKNLN
jgi:F-type H+-transporting ATPase subunit b